ncbi:MAG: FAD-dependent oxidoreductase [Bacillota bacterium]|nr:MAG: FAD-dependent oxidoreductase [Bacillota bacterium]
MAVETSKPAPKAVGAVLVVGGGIGGIQAALDLAEAGFEVHVVTKDPSLGGHMAQLDKTFPTNECSMCLLGPKMTDVFGHPNVTVHSLSTLVDLEGRAGDFTAVINEAPRYVDPAECTACGECAEVCPVSVPNAFNAGLDRRKAIFKQFPQAVPNKYLIEKLGVSPCRTGCPAGVNVQAYVSLIGRERFFEAWEVIRRDNPLPLICGTVCHHPCENVCQRGDLDEPMAIQRLKRFVGEYVLRRSLPEARPDGPAGRKGWTAAYTLRDEKVPREEKVAVVGGGPAGLACAYHLARRGYPVTVFEALPVIGGMLRVGIPEYRLPRRLLEEEIELIRREGVEIRTNVAIGAEKPLETLFDDGYRAVFLGIGAHEPTRVGIPGEDLEGVHHGVSFLRRVNLGERIDVGGRVIVVGGGNTAVDCARTALRLGADEVTVYYRRTASEMTALPEEVEDALEEGVRMEYLVSPVEVLGGAGGGTAGRGSTGATGVAVAVGSEPTGRVSALRAVRNELGEPGADGRRRPVPVPGSEFDKECDSVIIAISQAPDLLFLADSGLERGRQSTLVVDPYTLETNRPGVFAGGDAVTGPNTVVAAVAAGKEAAESIHRYLRGLDKREGRRFRVAFGEGEPIRKLPVDTRGVAPKPRVRLRKRSPASRKRSFDEVCLGMTEGEAVAEANRCLACGVCSECLLCEKACEKRAVRHDDKTRTARIRVGAVILAPGYETYGPEGLGEYGYGLYPNVVTALEFERMLSSTGPGAGVLERPSDGTHPKRVAFVQCVGSRDTSRVRAAGENAGAAGPAPYCSAVCCMFSTKQAIIAREHDPDIQPTVFYIDLRSYGKNFDHYVESAKEQFGVVFRRSSVSAVRERPDTRNLVLTWAGPDGKTHDEEFDLVVLATGLRPPAGAVDLARAAGIDLGPHGFAEDLRECGVPTPEAEPPVAETGLAGMDPCATTRPGVYAAGAFRGPKDIPETVMSGSAAAGAAGSLLAVARGTMAREKTFPPERDVSGEEPRVGVFVCRCGINIASVVDVPAVVEAAARLPGVASVKEFLFTCSQDSVNAIQGLIEEHRLNRVVVASCTVKTHGPLFREMLREAGLNQFLFHMVNVREECSWVHKASPAVATAKAVELVASAVAKARLLEPLTMFAVPVVNRALVVGGGVAGMGTAVTLAGAGFPVTIVEREDRLGGNLRHLHSSLEVHDAQTLLDDLVRRVESSPLITVLTGRELTEFGGHAGHFRSVIAPVVPSGAPPAGRRASEPETIEHGVLVVATGHEEYAPTPDSYPLYGKNPRVVTRLDFERRLAEEGVGWLGDLGRVAFIQCVGSRGEDRPENYCSRTCCSQAVKNALLIRKANPGAQVYVIHRDVRTYGFREDAYREAREKGVVFVRRENGRPAGISEAADGRPLVAVADADLSADLLVPVDLVVLSTGAVPSAGAATLARRLKVTLNEDGFFVETHAKLAPMDLPSQGVFLCGGAHAPKTIAESLLQAQGVAARAATILAKESLMAGGVVATVDETKCAACLTCVRVCPFNVPAVNERGVAEIDPVQCRGCGTCAGECPGSAIHLPCYRDDQMRATVEAMFRAAGG